MSDGCENRRNSIYHPSIIVGKCNYQKGSLLMRLKVSIGRNVLTGILLSAISTTSAFALTAKDVMEKMSKDDRNGYLTGLIDMRMFVAAQAGDAKLAQCIHDAYYRDLKQDGDAWSRLIETFTRFPEKDAATIVYLLVKKTCSG
jgi:hypothetical protein